MFNGRKCLSKPSKHIIDREGVASVVGTILALIVFLSILGLFINHYVPAMMSGNEHQHDLTVISQILQLKQSIDNMILYSTGQRLGTLSDYTPVTLGSAGVPMFATGTMGQMNVIPQAGDHMPSFSVSFFYQVEGASGETIYPTTVASGGGVFVNMPNRYYVQQSVLYQNDLVILAQQNGQVVEATPGFVISHSGGIALSILEVSVSTPSGANLTYSGLNTVGLTVSMLGLATQTYVPYTASKTPVTVIINTPYATAWGSFLNSTLSQAGLSPGYPTGNYTLSFIRNGFYDYTLELSLFGVTSLQITKALINIQAED
ncbi:MAG: hypothetical protein QXP70_04005 [Methanomassiliicoccales archaeon]